MPKKWSSAHGTQSVGKELMQGVYTGPVRLEEASGLQGEPGLLHSTWQPLRARRSGYECNELLLMSVKGFCHDVKSRCVSFIQKLQWFRMVTFIKNTFCIKRFRKAGKRITLKQKCKI